VLVSRSSESVAIGYEKRTSRCIGDNLTLKRSKLISILDLDASSTSTSTNDRLINPDCAIHDSMLPIESVTRLS